MKKLIFFLSLFTTALVNAQIEREVGVPYFDFKSSVGRIDSMTLAPTGERAYTLKNSILYQYELSPLRKINSMKVFFDTEQSKDDRYQMFVANDEKSAILYTKSSLRLLDMRSGKIIRTISFKSELGVLNGSEFLTLDNHNNGVVWDINGLTIKNKFMAGVNTRWSEKYFDITYANLIKAGNFIILFRKTTHVSGHIIVFDNKTYEQVWNFHHRDTVNSAISYDRETLYIENIQQLWHLVEKTGIKEELKKSHRGSILKINLLTAEWEFILKNNFKRNLHITLGRQRSNQQISPSAEYFILGYSGRHGFIYSGEYTTRAKHFLQFNNGEAAIFSRRTNYFQVTKNTRKYLKMKNKKGEVVSINDETFNKYNKVGIDHKEW